MRISGKIGGAEEGRDINTQIKGGETLKKQLAVIIGAILVISAVVAAIPAAASDWPEFQKDEVNVGRTDDSAPITNASGTDVSWVHQTVTGNWYGIDTVPIVVGHYVYVLAANANNAYLYKYYKNGSSANWANNRVTVGSGNFQNSCPAYGDGKIFVINTGYGSTPQLYAIDADSGSTSQASTGWSTNPVSVGTSDYQISCPITYYEAGSIKRLFFGSVRMSNEDPVNLSDDGVYYCYYANNGTQAWSRNTNSGGGYYWAGAAVIGDYLVYGDDKSNVTSVYLSNGTTVDELNISTLWTNFDAKEIRSSITWNETGENPGYGHIYFTSKGGYCYALGFNKSTGEFNTSDKWRNNIGYSTSTPAVYKGKVYVGHNSGFTDGKLYCLNEDDGSEVWNVSIGPVQSSPAISTWYDNGTNNEIYIYVTTNSATGGLYCIDKDGNEVWHNNSIGTQSCHRYCLAGAAISGGWVFYGNDGGYLHGLANWTRYDFNIKRATETPKKAWAYGKQVDTNPPDTANDPNTEFDSTEYGKIRVDDGTRQSDDSDINKYAAHRFNFSIDDNEVNFITKINVTWNGIGTHESEENGATLYIWNGTGYEQLDTTNLGTEVNLTGEKTSSISSYINSGNVTILVKQNTKDPDLTSHIETDYVKLVVTP